MSERISLNEAARRAGVSPGTLKRWARQKVVPLEDGRWTPAAAAQARIVARLRERGHSLESLKQAVREGRLAFGYVEDVLPAHERSLTIEQAVERSGLEPALIERIMATVGSPAGREEGYSEEDVEALEYVAAVLAAGFPLAAFVQLLRVYAQSLRRMADAEARLFHLYVHEPLIREGVPELDMAERMEGLAADLLPLAVPLMDYLHQRYLHHFVEQDVIGHMETEFGDDHELDRVSTAIAFIDLTGFTRYTEEEGDEEALDLIERFTETVEATLPAGASIVKTIGDELMIVSADPASLTEWAVGFQVLFGERPRPRVGIHFGDAVYRDGDYFGREVNLAARVVARAQGGEVMVTEPVVAAFGDAPAAHLAFDPIGEVGLKGIPAPTPLFVARRSGDET